MARCRYIGMSSGRLVKLKKHNSQKCKADTRVQSCQLCVNNNYRLNGNELQIFAYLFEQCLHARRERISQANTKKTLKPATKHLNSELFVAITFIAAKHEQSAYVAS